MENIHSMSNFDKGNGSCDLSLSADLDMTDINFDDLLQNCEKELLKIDGSNIFTDDYALDQLIKDEYTEETFTKCEVVSPQMNNVISETVKPTETNKKQKNSSNINKASQLNTDQHNRPIKTKIEPNPIIATAPIQITQQPIFAYVTPDRIQQFVIQAKIPAENTSPNMVYTTILPQQIQTQSMTKILAPSQKCLNSGNIIATNIIPSDAKIPIQRISNMNFNVGSVKETRSKDGGKRSDHNAIERKYRTSINEKIVELREMLVGVNASLNKSAVLRRAIDTIKHLRAENARLRQENMALKMNTKSTRDLLQFKVENNDDFSMTPPHSDMSLSPPHDEISSIPSSPDNDYSDQILPSNVFLSQFNDSTEMTLGTSTGMLDTSRIMLCVAMFAMITLNPFGILAHRVLGSGDDEFGQTGTERTLLSQDSDSTWRWQSSIYLVNLFAFLGCALKIFIFGDPILPLKSKEGSMFWKRKNTSEINMLKGDCVAAKSDFMKCLNYFGRSVPLTSLELITSFMWQLFRQFLHCLPGGKWISKNSAVLFFNIDKRHDAIATGRELALIYHQLNRLHLVNNDEDYSRTLGLYLALNAVNTAEGSAKLLTPNQLAEIYVCMALRLKQFPMLKKLQQYYLGLAKQELSKCCDDVPIQLNWLFTSYGQKYFLNHQLTYNLKCSSNNSVFTQNDNKTIDPLYAPLQAFREHLLQRALTCVVAPKEQSDKKNWAIIDAIAYTQMLKETNSTSGKDAKYTDSVASWWSNVVAVAAYWLLGDDKNAKLLYPLVDKIPDILLKSNNPLAQAILIGFQARSVFLTAKNENRVCKIFNEVCNDTLKQCDAVSVFLSESITLNNCKPPTKTTLFLQILACDWLLETRTSIWECNSNAVSNNFVVTFKRDLSLLESLTQFTSVALSRVFLYEAVVRLIARASPTRTQQLLERSLRSRCSTKTSLICGKEGSTQADAGKREQAHALYLACKHLPGELLASPEERAGMLAEAAKILEKIGDRQRLEDCYALMKAITVNSVA